MAIGGALSLIPGCVAIAIKLPSLKPATRKNMCEFIEFAPHSSIERRNGID
jgi:hypothetical protein